MTHENKIDSENEHETRHLTCDDLRQLWDARTNSHGKILARDKNANLAVRTNGKSLTLLAAFYSPLHRRSIQKAVFLINRRQDITQTALDAARASAAEFYESCCNPSALGSAAANRLKAHERSTLWQLSEIYFAGDHFAGLKNDNCRKSRRAYIQNHLLSFCPSVRGRAKLSFGDRQLARAPINDEDLANWKAAKLDITDGRPHTLNRTATYAQVMLSWLAENHYFPKDRLPKLPKAPESPEKYARGVTLDSSMLRALWNASQTLAAHERAFVRLLILTGQRRSIIAKLQWSEVRLQEEVPHLLIKQERSKNSRSYMLPLTPHIIDIIQSVPRFSNFDFVVAVPDANGRPISGFSCVKEKLDRSMREELGSKFYDWRFHDLRRNAKTGMAMLGIDGRVSELCLAHSPSWETKVEPHYNIYSYVPEKVDAMHKYSNYIMRIVSPELFSKEEQSKSDVAARLAKLSPEKIDALLSLLS